MSDSFNRATGWIVRRRWLTWLIAILITLTAMIGYRAPLLFQRSTGSQPQQDNPRTAELDRPLPDVRNIELGGADAVIVAESGDFFSPNGVRAMRAVVAALEKLPHVTEVLWLDRLPAINLFGLPEPLLPRADASPTQFAAALDKALSHPLARGQFLSGDGRVLLLMVRFNYLQIDRDEDCTTLLDETATRAAEKFPGVAIDFLVTGRVPVYLSIMESHEKNRWKYQAIAYCMIAAMSLILFRGMAAVLIVAIPPAVGVYWTLGLVGFCGFGDSPFIDVILPILVTLVGFTDGVHLTVQIRRNRAAGLSGFEAAKLGIQQVGLACALTSLTTAVGFGSLSFAHHVIIREFGWACVIGVMATFVAVITLVPLACSSWLGNRIHIGLDRGLIDTNLNRISSLIDFVLARKKWISGLAVASTTLLIAVSSSLRPDERQANAMPERSDPALAIKKLDRALGGLEYSHVDIRWNQRLADEDPEILEVVRAVDKHLSSESLFGNPISITNLLDALAGAGGNQMSVLDLLPPPLKRAFYWPERRHTRVTFRVQDLGIAQYGDVFKRLEKQLAELQQQHPDFKIQLDGAAIWRWKNLYQIVVDMAVSLGTASIVIFAVLGLAFRSVRIGLISVVPNMFPLAVAGAYLVASGQNLEIVMVCAFTCCLGIAVDDTIHFLTRYLEEQKTTGDQNLAIRRAFTGVGTALIMTTVVLISGFMTVIWSDAREHRIFSSMGAITVAAALFGDLIFLPAMLAQFYRVEPFKMES